ncbi:MAG: phosphoribosylformylglycinamidine synthase, partial [Myxococcota bacterium]
MLTLSGGPALSPFRADKLRKQLRDAGTPVDTIDAQHIYFVDLARPLDDHEQQTLLSLLNDAPPPPLPTDGLIVTPRPGTISPWSSKATDIAHNCGLADAVRRIERGTIYRTAPALDAAQLAPL